jgi:hypothetical protein
MCTEPDLWKLQQEWQDRGTMHWINCTGLTHPKARAAHCARNWAPSQEGPFFSGCMKMIPPDQAKDREPVIFASSAPLSGAWCRYSNPNHISQQL